MRNRVIDRSALDRVIAFVNNKGGVGKTTLSANIGGIFANFGYKVLLVDNDPQGNLGVDLGYADTEIDDLGRSLATALQLDGTPTIARSVRRNLDVIVGGEYLAGVAAALSNDPERRWNSLARTLAPLVPEYDIVLIDCPPGDKTLQVAGACAARWLITPVRGDAASTKGLDLLTGRMDEVMAVNPALELLGVVLFGVERNAKRVDAESRADIAIRLDSDAEVFATTIRHSSAVAQQTRTRGLLVHELDEVARAQPKWFEVARGDAVAVPTVTRTASSVADDLRNLAVEIIQRINAREAVNQLSGMEMAA